jgi:hypothetical protein
MTGSGQNDSAHLLREARAWAVCDGKSWDALSRADRRRYLADAEDVAATLAQAEAR